MIESLHLSWLFNKFHSDKGRILIYGMKIRAYGHVQMLVADGLVAAYSVIPPRREISIRMFAISHLYRDLYTFVCDDQNPMVIGRCLSFKRSGRLHSHCFSRLFLLKLLLFLLLLLLCGQ